MVMEKPNLVTWSTDCNKTNPTYTFFLAITIFSSFNWSFCLPYYFPLLSHDPSSCQCRSYSCDTNSITNTSFSHPTSHSLLLFPLHNQLLTSLFITFPLHDLLSTSIPTPRPTPYFSIHYIPTPWLTLYFYSHSMTHSLLLTSVDALSSSLHLCDSLPLPIMY